MFAQSGLYGAGNPGFVRSAPTVAVHLCGHADDACDMRGCVSNRSRPPTWTSRKTPCFMCFFEQDRCRARVTRRIDPASLRTIRPRNGGVVPGKGRKNTAKGVERESGVEGKR